MWMACTNRSTIEVAARNGLGALAFSFIDPDEAKHWADIYYDIIRSDECVPIGHCGQRQHRHGRSRSRSTTIATLRSSEASTASGSSTTPWGRLVTKDNVPGRTTLWHDYMAQATEKKLTRSAPGIGTPADFGNLVRDYENAGVDQVIFLQQGGLNQHEHICESLQLFGDEVLPEFADRKEAQELEKAERLAPFIEAALARKNWMPELADADIPVVGASVKKAELY